MLFGLVPWTLITRMEPDLGPPTDAIASLLFWLGVSFAWTAVVATTAQVWVARTRLRSFVGLQFARVLPLVVIPNTLVIFGLVLAFLTLGRLAHTPSGWASLTDDRAGQIVIALLVYAVSTCGLLISSRRSRGESHPAAGLRSRRDDHGCGGSSPRFSALHGHSSNSAPTEGEPKNTPARLLAPARR